MRTLTKSKSNLKNKIYKIISHPYGKFVGKKALFYLVVIFASLTLTWALPRFMPGNPIQQMTQLPPEGLSPERLADWQETREFLLAEYGLDKPIGQQFVDFWKQLFSGDLGTSIIQRIPVTEIIGNYLWYTLALVIPVLFLSFFIGNYIGAKVAYMKDKWSKPLYNLLILLQSAPFYWIGLIFYVVFIVKLKIFPSYGAVSPEYIPNTGNFWLDLEQYIHHWAAPFLTLMLIQIGSWATGMRAMTLYEKDSEYLLYANQLGFKDRLIRRYAKRNAMLPQVTSLNMSLNGLIGQTILIEQIFGWPGLGTLSAAAMGARDYPLIVGTFIITLLIVVVGNFFMDIIYGFIDPRIRTGSAS